MGTATTAPKRLETWEEVELNLPSAPEQGDISREQYHQFMLGKPARYSLEFRNFLMGFGVISFMLFEFSFTVYKLQPDDMGWVDEERKRAAAAKARMDAKLAQSAENPGA